MEKQSIMCDSAASSTIYASGAKRITIKRPKKTETQSTGEKGKASLSPEKQGLQESH